MNQVTFRDSQVSQLTDNGPPSMVWLTRPAQQAWLQGLVAAAGGVLGGAIASMINARQVGLVILLGLITSTALLAVLDWTAASSKARHRQASPWQHLMAGLWFSPISLPAAAAACLLLSWGA
jgi:uncharacterized membrane protein YfcA